LPTIKFFLKKYHKYILPQVKDTFATNLRVLRLFLIACLVIIADLSSKTGHIEKHNHYWPKVAVLAKRDFE